MIQEIEWFISHTRETFSRAFRPVVNRHSRLHRTNVSYDVASNSYIISADIDIDDNGRNIATLSYIADLTRFRIHGADATRVALMRLDSMVEEAIIEANIRNMREERDRQIRQAREEITDAMLAEARVNLIRDRHDSDVSYYIGYRPRSRYRPGNAVSQRYSGGGGGGGVPYRLRDPDSPAMHWSVAGGGGGGGYGYEDFVVSEGSYGLDMEAIRRRDEAAARGIKLLRENLTEEQLMSFDRDRNFCVTGGNTGTRYRIHYGRQMNIRVLYNNGRVKHGLCFLPAGNLCIGDTMLAQKFALECNEINALEVANKFPAS